MHDFAYNLHIQSIEGLYMESNNQPHEDTSYSRRNSISCRMCVVLGGFAYLFYDVNGDDLIVELEEYLEANPL